MWVQYPLLYDIIYTCAYVISLCVRSVSSVLIINIKGFSLHLSRHCSTITCTAAWHRRNWRGHFNSFIIFVRISTRGTLTNTSTWTRSRGTFFFLAFSSVWGSRVCSIILHVYATTPTVYTPPRLSVYAVVFTRNAHSFISESTSHVQYSTISACLCVVVYRMYYDTMVWLRISM